MEEKTTKNVLTSHQTKTWFAVCCSVIATCMLYHIKWKRKNEKKEIRPQIRAKAGRLLGVKDGVAMVLSWEPNKWVLCNRRNQCQQDCHNVWHVTFHLSRTVTTTFDFAPLSYCASNCSFCFLLCTLHFSDVIVSLVTSPHLPPCLSLSHLPSPPPSTAPAPRSTPTHSPPSRHYWISSVGCFP